MTAPTTMTVIGSWCDPDNTFAVGAVHFSPVSGRTTNSSNIIARTTVIAPLVNGAISVVLVRCADGYNVQEHIQGAALRRYMIDDAAGPVDLSTQS